VRKVAKNRQKQRRTYTAEVIKKRMDKTVVVSVTRSFIHPIYKKVMRKTTRLKAHDARNECQAGDRVRIEETRPMSKEKHWRVLEILERPGQIEQATEELSVIPNP
jgi:small subunit ribosomal protein S17